MRLPSNQLVELLERLQLCSAAQLRGCEPIVRRLAQDLPDFDSVWLDALVQQRVITPWQADVLQSEEPGRIRIAEYTLHAPVDEFAWRATTGRARSEYLLREVRIPASKTPGEVVQRLEELIALIEPVRQNAPSALVLPTRVVVSEQGTVFVVSQWQGGWPGEELLVRGGRLPCPAVAEIGRELLSCLAWLEDQRLLHGNIVASNLVLGHSGSVYLTNVFIRQLEVDHIRLTADTTLRDLDGIAPELAGTGRVPDVRCDLYALGCVLWRLLTSRPVVLTADPVTRIVKQKEHDIPDPRQHVPDCPEWLAQQIMTLTRRTPELRPSTADAALRQWMLRAPSGRSHCRRLVAQLPDRSQRKPGRRRVMRGGSRPLRRVAVAVAAIAICVTAGLGVQSGRLPQLLRMPITRDLGGASAVPPPTVTNRDLEQQLGMTAEFPLPLPSPDTDGTISLTPQHYYLASHLSAGRIDIRCESASGIATVLVPQRSGWILAAADVELSGIELRSTQLTSNTAVQPDTGQRGLLKIRSQTLAIGRCLLPTAPGEGPTGTALQWQAAGEGPTSVRVTDCVFSGVGNAIWLQQSATQVALDNVLLATRSGALRMDIREAGERVLNVNCHRVTQRFGVSVFDLAVRNAATTTVRLDATCGECVFDPGSALIRIAAPPGWSHQQLTARFLLPDSGNPAVVSPSLARMIYFDRELGHLVQVDEGQLQPDSLLYASPVFADMAEAEPESVVHGSELVDFEGPKLSRVMPGILASELPVAGEQGSDLPDE
jgi:uncharacterized protein YjhX (UPF0386 family)